MALTNQQRADLAVIRQLYLERYKAGVSSKVERFVRDYVKRLSVESMLAVGNANFAEMTKTSFQKLMVEFRAIENAEKNKFYLLLINTVRKFVAAEVDALLTDGKDAEIETARIFLKTIQSPIGGTDTNLSGAVIRFVTTIGSDIRAQAQTALIQRLSVGELSSLIGALSEKYPRRGIALIETGIQIGSQNTASTLLGRTPKYIWLSVLDSRTTDYCRGQHGKVYLRGKGPLPPAHVNCRSTTAPYVEGAGDVADEPLPLWIKRFDPKIRADLLSDEPLTEIEYIQRIKKYGIEKED